MEDLQNKPSRNDSKSEEEEEEEELDYEVVKGIGDDCGVVSLKQMDDNFFLIHTIDFFKSFIGFYLYLYFNFYFSFCSSSTRDAFVFGKICANHAISDIYAMNGTAHTALGFTYLLTMKNINICIGICVVPYGSESTVQTNLSHMISGAKQFLEEEGFWGENWVYICLFGFHWLDAN